MRLVLIDRDGVLNVDRADYVKNPGELEMIPGAAAAVARLNAAGLLVAVCTNQSPIGRGIFDEAMLARIHDRLRDELAQAGARLDAIFHCPDAPGPPSACRKPAPGMLQAAMRRFGATAGETPFVGDTLTDMQAALAAGCARHLVRTGHGARTQAAGLPADLLPVAIHETLADAVDALLGGMRP
ncbi:MAG: D-glycero-beta-D-manno-heptose 1,7-bisphosphate 7-phosphatase [Rhodospirillales bacterium]|nr:D-glycero-beta-D-manno-heptose 1,7-bisphosphate 7-phosphatase [Rhodospirillales bacterium]